MLSFVCLHQDLPLPQQHVITQEVSVQNKKNSFFPNLVRNQNDVYSIHFNSHISKAKTSLDTKEVTISIPELYSNTGNVNGDFITSPSHYQFFSQHRFSKYVKYDEFCKLEKSVSDIVGSYLKDEKRSYIIFLDDIFIQPMGVRKYWTFPKNYVFLANNKFDDNSVDFVIVDKFENINFL